MDAPDVMPTDSTPSSQSRSSSSGPPHQVGRPAVGLCDLAEPHAVRAVRGADHEHDLDSLAQLLYGGLAVRGRVTEVVTHGDVREALLDRLDRPARVVNGEGRLGEHGDFRRLVPVGKIDVIPVVHESHGRLPHGALYLLVSAVADQDDLATLPRILPGLVVHLRDERARRVDHVQVSVPRGFEIVRRRAVGGEHDVGAFRYVPHVFDGHRAAVLQRLDHVRVVHDLVLDVHGGPEALQGDLDDLYRSVHAGAEAARCRKEDLHVVPHPQENFTRSLSQRAVHDGPVLDHRVEGHSVSDTG